MYTGDTVDGLRHGHGTYTYSNSFFKYAGDWVHGKKHGQGALMFSDGGSYTGAFVNGEITGQGIKRWADGSTYTGDFLCGELHGEGTFVKANGERYEGGFRYNQRWGEGQLVYANGDTYSGRFEAHKPHGSGELITAKGDHYVGEWQDGKRHGRGDATFANGSAYSGDWSQDRRHGTGTWAGAHMGFSGQWVDDVPQGGAARIELQVDPEYKAPEQPVDPKAKAKPKKPPPKKGVVEEPPNYHGKVYLPGLAGNGAPSLRISAMSAPDADGQSAPATAESGREFCLQLWKIPCGDDGNPLPDQPLQPVNMQIMAPKEPEAAAEGDPMEISEAKSESGTSTPAEVLVPKAVKQLKVKTVDGVAAFTDITFPRDLAEGNYVFIVKDSTKVIEFGQRCEPVEQPIVLYVPLP